MFTLSADAVTTLYSQSEARFRVGDVCQFRDHAHDVTGVVMRLCPDGSIEFRYLQ